MEFMFHVPVLLNDELFLEKIKLDLSFA